MAKHEVYLFVSTSENAKNRNYYSTQHIPSAQLFPRRRLSADTAIFPLLCFSVPRHDNERETADPISNGCHLKIANLLEREIEKPTS